MSQENVDIVRRSFAARRGAGASLATSYGSFDNRLALLADVLVPSWRGAGGAAPEGLS